MKRIRVSGKPPSPQELYFLNQSSLRFIPSGSGLLDATLGGGWPLGRVVNVVGDRSTGKTLLAIEACANFLKTYPKGHVFYLEAEAAFDKRYAQALGLPVDRIRFIDDVNTVEGWMDALEQSLAVCNKKGQEGLFVVDSFDALSDAAEMKRSIDDNSFGASKARKTSELFRRITKRVERSQLCLFIISQIRDKLNVTFGKKHSRSGGKALDFYASQIVFLAEVQKIWKTKNAVKRPIGVTIRANVEKNKVGLPYRQCQMDILFGYGIDSISTALEYLSSIGRLKEVDPKLSKANIKKYLTAVSKLDDTAYRELAERIDKLVIKTWRGVETEFLPARRKY